MTRQRVTTDVHVDAAELRARMLDDVRRGLTDRPRWLPPKYFYDDAGSRLFERITELPEYYLTRAEESILRQIAKPLTERLRPRDLVELGPGSCRKARFLLDALPPTARTRYVAIDVGRESLGHAVEALAADYPSVTVHAVVADFERHLDRVPSPRGRRLVMFLGSTIGNFDPAARVALLAAMRQLLGRGGRILLGLDLVKDRATLEAAYDDSAGVTAEFNRNVLRHVNVAVDGDFDAEAFVHRAFYDAEAGRIEMHLIAGAPQRVTLGRLDLTLDFAAGEGIWTENSYKFTREGTEAMLGEAGLELEEWFTDADRRFGLALCRRATRG